MAATAETGGSDSPSAPRARAVVPAVAYMAVSSALSMLNRYLLHTRDPPLRFPSLLICVQAVIVGSLASAGLRACWHDECCESSYWPARLTMGSAARLAAVGLLFAGDILLTQLALTLAPVALVEVMKCLIPAIVLFEQSLLRRALPDLRQAIFVALICLGVVLATGSGGVAYNLEPGGILVAAGATAVASARLVAMQALLHGAGHCPMPLLLMYITPAMFLTGGTSFLVFEFNHFKSRPAALEPPHLLGSLALTLLSSLLAFGLNYSELWCIRVTSALVLTLVGALKTLLLVIATTLLAGRLLSARALIGSVLAIGGVAAMKALRAPLRGDGPVRPVELRGRTIHDEALTESWQPCSSS